MSLKAERSPGVADSHRASVLLCQEAQLHLISRSWSPSTYWNTPALGGSIPRDDTLGPLPLRTRLMSRVSPAGSHTTLPMNIRAPPGGRGWGGGQGQVTHTPTSFLPDPDLAALAVLASVSRWHRGH